MPTNTTVALLVVTGGAVLAWAGITDPVGGITGAAGRLLRGQAEPARLTATAGDVLAYAPAFYSSPTSSPSSPSSGTVAASYTVAGGSKAGAALVAEARKYLGTPYRFGGTTPAGFDCSGFTQYVAAHALGIKLPRVAASQQLVGQLVANLGGALPGDLLFWGAPAHHVGIYVGAGQMIAAPHTGDVVKQQAVYSGLTTIRRITGMAKTSKTVSV